jgi:hypothetical protein
MLTSNRSVFLRYSRIVSVTSRTAVYGPVRTVVWQGSAGDRRPYADLTRHSERGLGSAGADSGEPFRPAVAIRTGALRGNERSRRGRQTLRVRRAADDLVVTPAMR